MGRDQGKGHDEVTNLTEEVRKLLNIMAEASGPVKVRALDRGRVWEITVGYVTPEIPDSRYTFVVEPILMVGAK
jgi:hypothetical protein